MHGTECAIPPVLYLHMSDTMRASSWTTSGSLSLATKSGWISTKLFSSLLKHIWQQSH